MFNYIGYCVLIGGLLKRNRPTHWAKKGYKYNIFSKDDKRSNFFNYIPGYLIKPNSGVDIYVPPPYWDVPSKYSPSMGYTGSVK